MAQWFSQERLTPAATIEGMTGAGAIHIGRSRDEIACHVLATAGEGFKAR